MELFLTRLIQGIDNGAIYGFLGLALVCTYRGSRTLNMAQGEMAMFCTFVAWTLTRHGFPVVAAIAIAVVVGGVGGGVVERTLIRPLGRRAEYPALLVTIGLFLTINAAAGVIWDGDPHAFTSVVPNAPGDFVGVFGARLPYLEIVVLAVLAVVVSLLYALFRFTRLGLAMRVSASNPDTAVLLGVRVNTMNTLAWVLAGGVGALLGPLVAPGTTLSTTMFFTYIIYAVTAATLGGFDSPIGAVIGGLVIGLVENLAAGYISIVGDSLKLTVALVILLVVLMVRPSGLFGTREVVRV